MSLQTLLDRGAAFDAEYADGLSNHLPMALLALHTLGASDTRLERFAERYAVRLAPAPGAEAWPAGDAWTSRLGERGAWPAYRALFAQWIEWEGGDAVLSQALPRLMPGCGAAAFHGLIRTACAVSSRHAGELADGLAYWACRYLDLGKDIDGRGEEADPAVVLAELHQQLATRRFRQRLIFERMAAAARARGFRKQAAALGVEASTLPRLARQAAALYAASGDFTALHLVTACHAMRLLSPWWSEAPQALADFWLAYAAGFVASGVDPSAAPRSAPAAATWAAMRDAALASDDEHVIKLVFSCRDEFAASADEVWRHAAARAVMGSGDPAR